MGNTLRKIFYGVLSVLNFFTPKFKKILVYADPSLDGNSEAFLRYLINNTDTHVFCATKSHIEYPQNGRCIFFAPSLFKVAYHMMTCSVMIDSSEHRIKMKPTKKQMFMQLWHGSPIKYLTPSKSIRQGDYYSKISYCAEMFKDVLQKNEFNTIPSKMFLNGCPHNDYLFSATKEIDSAFKGKKIMWLPTYRHWGNVTHSKKDIPILDTENVASLDLFLRESGVKIYIKPHPLQSVGFESVLQKNFSNIVLVHNSDLVAQNITLYEFLAKTDALLTDYSSVMFDYLLVDRPIGFTIDDFDEYSKNVGFNFDNPLDLMAGMHLKNIDDLKLFVRRLVDGIDEYKDRREHVNNLVNHFKDDNSCKRVFEFIRPYIEKNGQD